MKTDPIVDEVREARKRLAEKQQFNIRKIFADAKSREALSGHPLVSYAEQTGRICEESPEYPKGEGDNEGRRP